jgi:chromosome segregation ATPase
MNSKAPVVILIVLCLALLAALVIRHNKAVNEKRTDQQKILQLSNEWATARARLDDLEAVNATLRSDRDTTKASLDRASNQLTQVRETLTQTEQKVAEATKILEEKTAALAQLEARAKELESENAGLEKQATDMRQAIGQLEGQISDTRKRLANAEGDRDYLLGELLRLQSEKATLERRLSDVVALREQIAKIREDLALSRRLESLRKSLYGADTRKGGEVLQRGVRREGEIRTPDLDVEVRRDGSSTIIPKPKP